MVIPYPLERFRARPTISSSSLVIAAWRALFISIVSSSISLSGVVGRIAHRDQLCGKECGIGFEHRRVDRELEVLRQQTREHELGRRRELDRAPRAFALASRATRRRRSARASASAGAATSSRRASTRSARSRAIVPVDEIVGHARGDFARDVSSFDGAPSGHVGRSPYAHAAHGVARLDPDGIPTHVAACSRAIVPRPRAMTLELKAPARPLSAVIRMTPARRAGLARLHERMIDRRDRRHQIAQHLGERVGVRARLLLRGLGAANLRRGDLLHRLGDLLRVLQRPDPIAKISRTDRPR